MKKTNINKLKRSRLYSEELGIKLNEKSDEEIFKWFLASILFGARISETIAKYTYRTFERYNAVTAKKILDAGWDELVRILDEGGYVRYDFSTADKLLGICEILVEKYGSLINVHEQAKDAKDLEQRLLEFKGIGPVTVNIFLRELRPFWDKADPKVLPIVKKCARRFGIHLDNYRRKSVTFVRIESGLIRLRKKYHE